MSTDMTLWYSVGLSGVSVDLYDIPMTAALVKKNPTVFWDVSRRYAVWYKMPTFRRNTLLYFEDEYFVPSNCLQNLYPKYDVTPQNTSRLKTSKYSRMSSLL